MAFIVLDEQQAKIVSETQEEVELRDPNGKHLGYVWHGFDEEEIAEALRRAKSDEPRYTTAEVLDYLRSLEQA